MAYGDPTLLHEDKFLTQISVDYAVNTNYFSDQIFKTVPVTKQSDKYKVFNKDNQARVTDDHRSPGARSNEIPPRMLPSEDTYFATEHSLKDVVVEEEEQNADEEYDPRAEATETLTDTILLNREYTFIQMVTTAANYATGHTVTLSGTDQWDDPASTPTTDVKTARKQLHDALGLEINTVVMGWDVAWALEDHPDIVDKFGANQMSMTNDEVIARVLRIPNFFRAEAQYNTAPYGQPAVMSDLWGNDVLFAYVPNRPGKRIPAFGYEFAWRYPDGNLQRTRRWYDIDREAELIKVSRRYDFKFIAIDSNGKSIGGYLIKAAV